MHYYANGRWFQDPYEAIWYKKHAALATAAKLRSNPRSRPNTTISLAKDAGVEAWSLDHRGRDVPSKYIVSCDDHGNFVGALSLKDARVVAAYPANFCEDCQARRNPEGAGEINYHQRSRDRKKLLKKRMARKASLGARPSISWEMEEPEAEEVIQARVDNFYQMSKAIQAGEPVDSAVAQLYQKDKTWAGRGEQEEDTRSRLQQSFSEMPRLRKKHRSKTEFWPRSRKPQPWNLTEEDLVTPSKYLLVVSPHLYNIWTFGDYLLHPLVRTKKVGDLVRPVHIGRDDLQWCLKKAEELSASTGKKHFVMPQKVAQRAFNLWVRIGATLMPCLYINKGDLIHLGSPTLEQAEYLKTIVLRKHPETQVWIFPKSQEYGPDGELLTAYSPNVW